MTAQDLNRLLKDIAETENFSILSLPGPYREIALATNSKTILSAIIALKSKYSWWGTELTKKRMVLVQALLDIIVCLALKREEDAKDIKVWLLKEFAWLKEEDIKQAVEKILERYSDNIIAGYKAYVEGKD